VGSGAGSSGVSDYWVGGTISNTMGVGSGSTVSVLLAMSGLILIVTNVKTESSGIDVAVTENKHGTKDWLGENVQDTIEDSLGVWGNKVATLGHSPGNWVDEPKEDGPDTAHEEGLRDVRAENIGVLASDNNNVVCNTEESDGSKDEVTPLVGRGNEGANKASHNHNLIEENGVENSWPWQASSEKEIQEKKLMLIRSGRQANGGINLLEW
jgi:hypothetical protein